MEETKIDFVPDKQEKQEKKKLNSKQNVIIANKKNIS